MAAQHAFRQNTQACLEPQSAEVCTDARVWAALGALRRFSGGAGGSTAEGPQRFKQVPAGSSSSEMCRVNAGR
eukprot:10666753-Alexandrium_andersonii.AAC.1